MAVRANSTLASRRRPAFDAARGINIARPPPCREGFRPGGRKARSPILASEVPSEHFSGGKPPVAGMLPCPRLKEIGRVILRR